MLFIFMLSLGTHVFNTRWLVHDFNAEHGRNSFGVQAGELQAKNAVQGRHHGLNSPSKALSNTEHKLLHSADPAQPLLLTHIPDGLHDLAPRTIRIVPRVTAISPADPEPPFRPPITAYRA